MAALDQMLYRLRNWAGLGKDVRDGTLWDAGVEVRAHVFRHTFAVNCLKEGLDIKQIADLLGHTSVATTQLCPL